MILSSENYFLIFLGLVWIIGAVIQDLRRREVDNIWNFSLIAFALSYRLFLSVYTDNHYFILNGILGFFIFLFLGNLFYYMRLFAGGDAKLLIALGAILPFSLNWLVNFEIFLFFIILFLTLGSIYTFMWSLFLVSYNFDDFKKELKKQSLKYKLMFNLAFILGILWLIIFYILNMIPFLLIGLIILLFPLLFVFAKSVEEGCMIRNLDAKQVTEGDWLYRDIIVKGKIIRSRWEGISKEELKIIRKYHKKKILIKQGIPFTPSFLLAFLSLLFISFKYKIF